MKGFLSLPIRLHMFLLVFLLALPATGVIIHAGMGHRQQAFKDAATDSARLVYALSSEINIMVRSSQQLAETLAHLPEVQHPGSKTISPLLVDLIHKYPQYANIIITDSSGLVLASAVPSPRPVSLADRKAFKEAKQSGRFSAGEYVFGKLVPKPLLNFAYPLTDSNGTFRGTIAIALDLGHTKHLLEKVPFPSGAEYVLLDHKGIFLYRTYNLEKFMGTPIRSDLLKTMVDGPDEATREFISNDGIHRVSSYRKLRLSGSQPPFMYVRAGFPIQSVYSKANISMMKHLSFMILFFAISILAAWFISKKGIVDRIAALQDASRRLAAGEFAIRVSEHVAGSELGELAKTFDNMACSLAEREQTLKESEAKFRSLFESMQEGVIISEIIRQADGTPDDFRCIDVNPSFEQILNVQRDQVISRSLLDIFPGAKNVGIDYLREVALSGNPRHIGYYHAESDTYFEIHVICPDSERLAIIFSDVSEQKRIQDELIRTEKLESLGVLAGGIAHDFNNFLAGILGNISFARMLLDPSHKAHKLLGEAEKATQRATDLARQLLTFARGGAPVKKVISVQQVIRESATLVLRGTNVKDVLEIPHSLHNVEADEGQITQAFHNIIINAVQAMPNSGCLTIKAADVRVEEAGTSHLLSGDYVMVSFTDEGHGIPPEDLERIFDPYFTTKAKGTGLGLASVYSIISRHGGHINVISVVGRGTTFEVYLPACGKEIRDTIDTDVAPVLEKQGKTAKILIMDDDEVITNLLVDIFEHKGYKVETCANGGGAIACYRDALERGTPYDAVIMDLTIPGGMGGKEAAAHLLRFDPNACLIVSSGYSNDPVMSDYSSYGFKAAIAKPFMSDNVLSALDAALINS